MFRVVYLYDSAFFNYIAIFFSFIAILVYMWSVFPCIYFLYIPTCPICPSLSTRGPFTPSVTCSAFFTGVVRAPTSQGSPLLILPLPTLPSRIGQQAPHTPLKMAPTHPLFHAVHQGAPKPTPTTSFIQGNSPLAPI